MIHSKKFVFLTKHLTIWDSMFLAAPDKSITAHVCTRLEMKVTTERWYFINSLGVTEPIVKVTRIL